MNPTNPINPSNPSSPFRFWLSLVLLVLSFVTLYHHTLYKMGLDWLRDDNYSHGFLIPLIAGFLLWQERDKLSNAKVSPSNAGLFILLAGLCLFVAARTGAELFTERFSMLMVIWGGVLFILGRQHARIAWIPIAYLIFMIPLPAIIWNQVAFPLKLFATKLATGAITFLSIPVYREGNIIHLANTTLEVVDACSGIRSLTSLLAISAAFALITDHSRLKKWVLFLSAVPIAIFVNILRLTVTAALAHRYGSEVAQGFLHEMSGLMVFAVAIVSLFGIHVLLQKIGSKPEHPDEKS